ncbi:MAG: stage III sporulation protein AE [Clostridia bacterium]|nr:stage III sporulation protein AE [Clostridia bacterium]
MKKIIVIILLSVSFLASFGVSITAKADELTDNVNEQMENLDLTELDEYYENIVGGSESATTTIWEMLNGEFEFDFNGVGSFILNSFFVKIKSLIAPILSVIAVAVFLSFLNGTRGSFLSDSVYESIFIACFSVIVIILIGLFTSVVINVKNDIENLTKLNEIMSPIIITLMLASGANTSAVAFKPSVAFLSGGIMQIMRVVVIPLIGVSTVFGILSYFSKEIKLKKFSELFTSVIKWIFGITISVYGVFLTVQGIGSASYDGISVKAAKYVLSNSVPIVGGFLKDGFDIVIAGSVLIKNTVGLTTVFLIFYTLLSTVALIAAISLLLNFTASVTESFSDERISGFCTFLSKKLTFVLATFLIVGFMFFLTVLMMIFTANGVL